MREDKLEGHTLINEDFPYKCPICNKGFNNTKSLSLHIAGAHKQDRHMQPVTLYNPLTRLDITVSELENYKHTHDTCEICGRKLDPTVKQSDTTVTYLCIDHIHSTAKFRGLLCGYCNGALGWFEKNKSEVLKYLEVKGEEHY